MKNLPHENSIPVPVEDLLGVFRSKLPEVQFPDINTKALEELVKQVKTSSEELAKACQQVEKAQKKLSDQQENLVSRAQKGLAYAKIYAQDNQELLSALNEIHFKKVKTNGTKLTSEPKQKSKQPERAASKAKSSEPPMSKSPKTVEPLVAKEEPATES